MVRARVLASCARISLIRWHILSPRRRAASLRWVVSTCPSKFLPALPGTGLWPRLAMAIAGRPWDRLRAAARTCSRTRPTPKSARCPQPLGPPSLRRANPTIPSNGRGLGVPVKRSGVLMVGKSLSFRLALPKFNILVTSRGLLAFRRVLQPQKISPHRRGSGTRIHLDSPAQDWGVLGAFAGLFPSLALGP